MGRMALARTALLLLLVAVPAAAEVEWSCDFRDGFQACGFVEQARIPGRATIVRDGRAGGAAVRLRTEPGDDQVNGSGRWERNDLLLPASLSACEEGREAWWAHSVLFPDDYVVPPYGGGVVMDFHHKHNRGQANFHVDAMPHPVGLRLRGYGGPVIDRGEFKRTLGPVRRNTWYDFVYHVRWSSESDGYLHAWMNGRKVLSHRGPTLYRGFPCYLKLANYHSPFGQPSSVIHSRIIRGTKAEDVALGPLEGVEPGARSAQRTAKRAAED